MTIRAGRPEAAAAIWNRLTADPLPGRSTADRRARSRGVVQAGIGSAIGALLFMLGARVPAWVAWVISGCILGAALLSPGRAYAAIGRLGVRLGEVVGLAMTWILLAPLFYLFFAPFGLLLRRGRRDLLERRVAREASSAWKPKSPAPEGPAAYERQF